MAIWTPAGASFEVTDWDMSSRTLTGLKAGRLPDDGQREEYSDSKVQHELKTIAVRLFNHQKMTKMFQEHVSYAPLSMSQTRH